MIKLHRPIALTELANLLEVDLKVASQEEATNADLLLTTQLIDSIAPIETATAGQVTFLANQLYAKYLNNSKASAIIITPEAAANLAEDTISLLITPNPRLVLAKLLTLANTEKLPNIHANCVIGKNVQIGNNVTLEAGVVIGDDCVIGDYTVIKANAVLYDQVRIGKNCIIHSNTVIGSDGFGYAKDHAGSWVKIPHLGGVIIEDQVEIGSNTSVDRGCIGDTWIKQGVIIDNLVQIAHNVEIGANTAIAGCVAIAGSTVIGSNCLIGGAVSIAGHLKITDQVNITATSSISKSISKPGTYASGFPAKDHLTWKRNVARFNLLDRTIKELQQKIDYLLASTKDT